VEPSRENRKREDRAEPRSGVIQNRPPGKKSNAPIPNSSERGGKGSQQYFQACSRRKKKKMAIRNPTTKLSRSKEKKKKSCSPSLFGGKGKAILQDKTKKGTGPFPLQKEVNAAVKGERPKMCPSSGHEGGGESLPHRPAIGRQKKSETMDFCKQ